jgi:hypothetical protein
MSNYNALLRSIRLQVEASLIQNFAWQPEAIKGMRDVTRGRRSRQTFFNLRFEVGQPIQRDDKEAPELPFVVYECFDFPTEGGQPGDVRIYCAPLPQARQGLEQAFAGGPYEGAIYLRFDLSRGAEAHAPGGQNLTEAAFIAALAHEWSDLNALLNPPEADDDGSDEERRCPACRHTTRIFHDDPEDPEGSDEWVQPTYCGHCGQAIPHVAEVVA